MQVRKAGVGREGPALERGHRAERELGAGWRKLLSSTGRPPTPAGPLANLRHNLHEVVASLGCTVELQINNTRAAWRVSTAPLRAVFKDLLVRTLLRTPQGRRGPSPGGPPRGPEALS